MPFEKGGNDGTGALTVHNSIINNFMIRQDRL